MITEYDRDLELQLTSTDSGETDTQQNAQLQFVTPSNGNLSKRNFIRSDVDPSVTSFKAIQRESDINVLMKTESERIIMIRFHLIAGIFTLLQLIASSITQVKLNPTNGSRSIFIIWEEEDTLHSSTFMDSAAMTAGLFIIQSACLIEHALCYFRKRFLEQDDFVRELTWAVTAVVIHCQLAMLAGVTDLLSLYFVFITSLFAPYIVYTLKKRNEEEHNTRRLRLVPSITMLVHITPIFLYFGFSVTKKRRDYAIGHLIAIILEYVYLQVWYFRPNKYITTVVIHNIACSCVVWVYLAVA